MREPVKLPTNRQIGLRLGVSETSVSRYRSGNRIPSIEVQTKIEQVLGWSVSAQAVARSKEGWTKGFERALRRFARRELVSG